MDVTDAIVCFGIMATAVSSVYLYLRWQSATSRELEEFRQLKISERAQNRPREWWQEAIVNLTANPAVIEKLLPLAEKFLPNVNVSTILQALQNQKR